MLVRSPSSMFFFECASYDSQRQFFKCPRQVLTLDAFEAFCHGNIFNESVFGLGKKQGMLVNNECSSWYSRVGVFSVGLG